MQPPGEFTVRVHWQEAIFEVVYPPEPTAAAVDRYEAQLHALAPRLGSAWDSLVDQTGLVALSPELASRIATMNAWASARGMRRTVRVVRPSALAELQARRILADGGVRQAGAIFRSREEAWATLRQPLAGPGAG